MTFWRVGKGLADLSPRRLPRHHPSFLRSAAPPLCPALDLFWLLPHPWGTGSGTHLSAPVYSRIAVLASFLLLGQLYFSWLYFSHVAPTTPLHFQRHLLRVLEDSYRQPQALPLLPALPPPPDSEMGKQLQYLPVPLSSAWPQDTL